MPCETPKSLFAELLARTNFSFLLGASHPREMAETASALGHTAIGVADDCSLAGIVRAHEGAKEAGIKLLVGARFEPADGPGVALYAMHRAGYANLCRIITDARRSAPKGEYRCGLADLCGRADGLIGVLLPATGRMPPGPSFAPDSREIGALREAFGDRLYQAVCRHLGNDDSAHLARWFAWCEAAGIPAVGSNDPLYHARSRQPLADVVACIRHGCTLAEAGFRVEPNGERCLKPASAMLALFRGREEAVARSAEIAARCTFSLDELRYEYPDGICPPGLSPAEYLRRLTYEGASRRYPDGVPLSVGAQIEHELLLIGDLHYEPYFLTINEIVAFARSRGILCQGRGSAANSAVCFCLGVTSVDPAHHDLLFERFISKERHEPPDIDVDFENGRREEVFEHIYARYGRERAGLTAVVITYRRRSALREVGKVMGLSLDQVDSLAKHVDNLKEPEVTAARMREAGLNPDDPALAMTVRLASELKGFPRHLSQHVGGFVMTRGRLDELVPVENAAMDGRTVVQWDKDDLDALGILKVDCLALGMLTAVQRSFALIQQHHRIDLDLARVLATDHSAIRQENAALAAAGGDTDLATPVYDMICAGDTVGVFQIESRAQMQMLPRLKPRTFYDLVIEVAIVRPGPIQGGMVHPYLRRRDGLELVVYPHDCTEPVLRKTLGVPLFQEQVMQLAVVAAGYTPGEADGLRKAMAAWKRNGALEKHREKLLKGMRERGITDEFAERLFEQIRGFSSYGFPESHAASFALIVYVSCFLKRYYPAAFAAAVINSQPMGFYSVASLVRDAREHGVAVLPPDINHSGFDCSLEAVAEGVPEGERPATWGHGGPCLRLGLAQIRGVSRDVADGIAAARETGGAFKSVEDFARRAGADRRQLALLANGDALASVSGNRREALWQVRAWEEMPPLLRALPAVDDRRTALPTMDLADHVVADYAALGLSLRAHPISLVRGQLSARGVITAAALRGVPDGGIAEIAGVVLCRQRPGTASGVVFMSLEDETGVANIVIWARVFEQFRLTARMARLVSVRGKVERDRTGKVLNVIAERILDLRAALRGGGSDAVSAAECRASERLDVDDRGDVRIPPEYGGVVVTQAVAAGEAMRAKWVGAPSGFAKKAAEAAAHTTSRDFH
jgi:error-prone DNA polymerase